MTSYSVHRYRENQLLTASPGQILVALHDGAIRFAEQAKLAILAGDATAKGQAVGRALAIISELNSTLDHERAPDLCARLQRLYNYMAERLSVASLQMQTEPIEEVVGHLQGLRESWLQVLGQQQPGLLAAQGGEARRP